MCPGQVLVVGCVGGSAWDGPMTCPPTDTCPGVDACAGADVCAQPGVASTAYGWPGDEVWVDAGASGLPSDEVWVDADGVPSLERLAVWFVHPSAALNGADVDCVVAPAGAGSAAMSPAAWSSARRVSAGQGEVLDSVGPRLWDGPMTFPPTDTRPGADACPGADVCAQPGVDSGADGWAGDEVWVDADGVPSAAQLAAWFAHPSAVLEDTWADATPAAAAPDVVGGAAVPGEAVDPAGVPGWVELEWLDTPVRSEVRALMALAPGLGCVKFFGQVLWCFQAAVAVLWWSARACAGVR